MARASVEVVEHEGKDEYADTYASYRRGGMERAAPPLPLDDQERRALAEEVRALGGLFILGTERHEARRIDNQLRGRSGRQGDPGESRYYVALEDQLWKIFNANMMENPVLRMWPPMEEVTAGFLSKMIHKTQERIENHFFESRKNVLEYDDVLNAQREHIYGLRREILLGKDVRAELKTYLSDLVKEMVENAWMLEEDGARVYDHSVLYEDLNEIFPLVDYATVADLEKYDPGDALSSFIFSVAMQAYENKQKEAGPDMESIERWVLLKAINDKWMEHLQTVDYIREGIGLRGYGQVDPLVAYKRETYDTFQNTLKSIRDEASRTLFMVRVQNRAQLQALEDQLGDEEFVTPAFDDLSPESVEQHGVQTLPAASVGVAKAKVLDEVDWTRVGRNDPCPCGSGKKFKECHYKSLREQGVI
jgi:preprotein translocase subunit SecA